MERRGGGVTGSILVGRDVVKKKKGFPRTQYLILGKQMSFAIKFLHIPREENDFFPKIYIFLVAGTTFYTVK